MPKMAAPKYSWRLGSAQTRSPRLPSCNRRRTSKENERRGRGPIYNGREVRGGGLLLRWTEGREVRGDGTGREWKGIPQSQDE